jgi:hypothetical protein
MRQLEVQKMQKNEDKIKIIRKTVAIEWYNFIA